MHPAPVGEPEMAQGERAMIAVTQLRRSKPVIEPSKNDDARHALADWLESVSRIPSFIINVARQYSRRTHNDPIAKLAADKDFSEFDNLGARASSWSTLCVR
jgi:hypothetical protein